jgi:hypothetical protein
MKEKYLFLPPKPKFTNKVIDKKELKFLTFFIIIIIISVNNEKKNSS